MKIKRILLTAITVVILSVFASMLVACSNNENTPPPVDKNTYSIVYVAGNGGRIVGKANQSVAEGADSSEVVALADSGYVFTGWSDGISQDARCESNVTANISVTANFERRYAVNYYAAEHGRIAGEAHQSIPRGGDTVSVTAVPDKNYEFVGWSDGKTEIGRKDKNVSNDIGVTALFALKKYSVEYSAENGYIIGNERQSVYHGGMSDTVTAAPQDGYEFVGWSDGVESITRNESNVVNNISITAIFKIKEFTVNYSNTVGGALIGNTEQIVSWGETTQAIEAVPEYSYKFIGWSDGVADAVRTDISVQSNINVTALFEKIGKTVFEYVLRAGGKIQGDTYQEVDYGDQTSSVAAIADFGYKFVEWSDGVTANERRDHAGDFIDGKVIIEAIFEFDNPSNIDMFDFVYNSDTNGYSVALSGDKTGYSGECFIPDRYNGLPVTEIMPNGFSNSGIEYVYIPKTIKTIRVRAFNNCTSLKRIDGMECVEYIQSSAFACCNNLEYLVLPRTLNKLTGGIFRLCSATVYTRLTEEQLYELNPLWKSRCNEDFEIIYIGNGEIPSADDNNEVVDYGPDAIVNDKTSTYARKYLYSNVNDCECKIYSAYEKIRFRL